MKNVGTIVGIILVVVLVVLLLGSAGMMGFSGFGMMGGYGNQFGFGVNPIGAIQSLVFWALIIGGVVLLVVWLARNAGHSTLGASSATHRWIF